MSLNSKRLTVLLLSVLSAVIAVFFSSAVRLPGHNQDYAPTQPIAFSHAKHAGQLGVDCQYCHMTAERSEHAGYPAVSTCLNCHRYLSVNHSPEVQKIYQAAGLDANAQPDPSIVPKAIEWVKVHSLPAFVRFDHSRHVVAGVACMNCHGPVQNMERVRQVETLSMGMCIQCHRQVNTMGLNGKKMHASLDCAACHH